MTPLTMLLLCVYAHACSVCVVAVFQKLQTIPMRNYPTFLNLLTTFIYVRILVINPCVC